MTQRVDALKRANEVRIPNARAYRVIRCMPPTEARHTVASILTHPEGLEQRMRVSALLRTIQGIGQKRASNLLAHVGINADEHLIDIAALRRADLARLINAKEQLTDG